MNPPETWSVETVRGCNLRCPICAVGAGIASRPPRHMSAAEYDTIATKISPFARHVALHVWGEPMLNRDIFDIIAKTLDFATAGIHTNANCLTDDEARRLALSGAHVSVSIDGMTQETYARYRVGGSLERALRALRIMAAQHKAPLAAQFLEFAHNTHEIPAFLDMCRDLGIPGTIKTPQVKMNPVLSPVRLRPPLSMDALLACPDPQSVGTVLADGTMVVCCYDFDALLPYGNLLSQDLAEIWEGPAHKAVLEAFAMRNPPEFCLKNCYMFR